MPIGVGISLGLAGRAVAPPPALENYVTEEGDPYVTEDGGNYVTEA